MGALGVCDAPIISSILRTSIHVLFDLAGERHHPSLVLLSLFLLPQWGDSCLVHIMSTRSRCYHRRDSAFTTACTYRNGGQRPARVIETD